MVSRDTSKRDKEATDMRASQVVNAAALKYIIPNAFTLQESLYVALLSLNPESYSGLDQNSLINSHDALNTPPLKRIIGSKCFSGSKEQKKVPRESLKSSLRESLSHFVWRAGDSMIP